MSTMQAAVRERYGPDHLKVREIPVPNRPRD